MSNNDRNRPTKDSPVLDSKSVALEFGSDDFSAFSEWLDQSLAELVEQHEEFVTRKSTRGFFSR